MMPGRLVHPYFGCVQINIKEKRDIMQKIAVCVSGGGTNLQAIIDSIADGIIKNTEISVVISNKKMLLPLDVQKRQEFLPYA